MNRKTILALIVFVLLLAAAYAVVRSPEKGDRSATPKTRPLSAITASAVQRLTVRGKSGEVVLERDGTRWRLTKPVAYPADRVAVEAAVERLGKLEFGDLVSELPTKQSELEVDDRTGIRVTAEGGGKVLGELTVGKVVEEFTMVRPAGKNQIYQAVGAFRMDFDREVRNWRDRTILELKQDEVRGLEVTSPSGRISLARKDQNSPWKVESSTVKVETLDESVPRNLVASLSSLAALDFADGVTAEKAGLDQPSATIVARLAGGKSYTVLVGASEKDNTWLKRADQPQIFVVQKASLEGLARRPIDFRDKTVLSFKPEDLVSLSVTQQKEGETSAVKLTRKGAEWSSGGKPLKDADKVKQAVEALATLKAESFASHPAKEYGLDKPAWTFELELKDRTRHQLAVGAVEKDGFYGLTRRGVADLFTFRKYSLERFQLEPKNFK